MLKPILIAAAAGLGAHAMAPAHAETAPMLVERVSVTHADLDLKTAAGAEAMLARLDEAATAACGGHPAPAINLDPLMQARQREYRRCKAAALDAATFDLGAPLVRAAHVSRGKAADYALKDR